MEVVEAHERLNSTEAGQLNGALVHSTKGTQYLITDTQHAIAVHVVEGYGE